MSNNFMEFLDNDGKFIVKKEGDLVLLVWEVEIDGKTYHSGTTLPDNIKAILDGDISKCLMREVNKIKNINKEVANN